MLEKHDVKRSRTTRAGRVRPQDRRTRPRLARRRPPARRPPSRPYGLKLQRYFTAPGDDGFANVEWELRTAAITGENGKMVFEQKDVEVPKSWTPDRDQRRRPEVLPRHRSARRSASARSAS